MSATDSGTGSAFIWLVCSALFISIVAGGGCLIVYMILPKSQSTSWLPIAGVTLVCLPWLFWFLNFLYRAISSSCGFRVSSHFGAGTGGGGCNISDGGQKIVAAQASSTGKVGKQISSSSTSFPSNNLHESEMPLPYHWYLS